MNEQQRLLSFAHRARVLTLFQGNTSLAQQTFDRLPDYVAQDLAENWHGDPSDYLYALCHSARIGLLQETIPGLRAELEGQRENKSDAE